MQQPIPPTFLTNACEILAHTSNGLSGSEIIAVTSRHAFENDVDIPHPTYPFGMRNKRTALFENLMEFPPQLQYTIIKELCKHSKLKRTSPRETQQLLVKLTSRYSHLNNSDLSESLDTKLVEQTKHWLDAYPSALSQFNSAIDKYHNTIFQRNLLDDLRLALEELLKQIFDNDRSLENQIQQIGTLAREHGGSREFVNMFVRLVDYYCKYQNTYVKHSDSVNEEEIDFIFEISSSFMKHLVRLRGKTDID